MRGPVVWKIAAPMFGLGVLLLGLGMFAAWEIHERQQLTSEMVAREVDGMVAVSELHITMREIRYQVNLFLRTRLRRHLDTVTALEADAERQLNEAAALIRDVPEDRLIAEVGDAYRSFVSRFHDLVARLSVDDTTADVALAPTDAAAMSALSDDLLTNDVLRPLHDSLKLNQQVVQRMDDAARAQARLLMAGFLLLGLCGGLAGLLVGTAIARAVGRSLVQLTVTVRDVAGRLPDPPAPVTLTHSGDLSGIEASLAEMEKGVVAVIERLRRSENELLRKEQLARVGQLAAGLAHELRNPLTPMKMLVQAAIERGDGGLGGRSLDVIHAEISRMETAIQAFLDFARPPLPAPSPIDLREVVSPTLDLIAERASRQRVEIRSRLPADSVVTAVDRGQLRQLLLNVLLNAIEAMPRGGVLEVSLDRRRLDPGRTSARGDEDAGNWIALTVSDEGAGIPDDLLPRVFEPFVTTKESGTGLGLPVCSRIAADHGGRITARNRATGGVEVELLLPATPQA
ncbi:MAG: sensor histidine kinase [Planctomycetaceae bacterium]